LFYRKKTTKQKKCEKILAFSVSCTTDFLQRVVAEETPHAVPQPMFIRKNEDSSAQAQT